ncbi:MAG: hypothetical protein KJN71_01780 [Acidimicrobiia bacterium]|nr:hypothetical protein [Acidimicrobiia bacterium]
MTTPRVSITDAFSEAWERMKTILFRPFDIGKWFALGFTAWLAGLTGTGGGGSSSSWNVDGPSDAPEDLDGVAESVHSVLREAWERSSEWIVDNPLWVLAGVLGCGLLLALFLVILWVSSRGKFMFLDNVVHDRAEVVAPWKRYRRPANSHFFFQLAFVLAVIVVVLGSIVALLGLGAAAWTTDVEGPFSCLLLVIGAPVLLLVILTVAYVQFFLDAFVVPLMHRYDLPVLTAWSRFGEILRRHPGTLLLSGLFLFVLALAVGVAILVSGLLTCCVGFLFLMIPYIGTVLILPVPVTYRAFTVALLDQIDPGYFPQESPAPTEAPPPAPPKVAPEAPPPPV